MDISWDIVVKFGVPEREFLIFMVLTINAKVVAEHLRLIEGRPQLLLKTVHFPGKSYII